MNFELVNTSSFCSVNSGQNLCVCNWVHHYTIIFRLILIFHLIFSLSLSLLYSFIFGFSFSVICYSLWVSSVHLTQSTLIRCSIRVYLVEFHYIEISFCYSIFISFRFISFSLYLCILPSQFNLMYMSMWPHQLFVNLKMARRNDKTKSILDWMRVCICCLHAASETTTQLNSHSTLAAIGNSKNDKNKERRRM